jgi:hypothetical protein
VIEEPEVRVVEQRHHAGAALGLAQQRLRDRPRLGLVGM